MHVAALLLALSTVRGWGMSVDQAPARSTPPAAVTIRVRITNRSSADAYVVVSATGPGQTFSFLLRDVATGKAIVPRGTCSDDIYNVSNYNALVEAGATVTLEWPLFCFAKIDRPAVIDLELFDLALTTSKGGSTSAVARIHSNRLRLQLEP